MEDKGKINMKQPIWTAYLDLASIVLNSMALVIMSLMHRPAFIILHGVFLIISMQHLLNSFIWVKEEPKKDEIGE